ncbi:MAG: hypothetical protein HY303_08630 [Candidatus Wallbacteria bacterium]|nr:hypothetical protein [Candidatus Wallbacteria bacterium]
MRGTGTLPAGWAILKSMDLGAALIALAIALVVKVAVMVLCGWLLVHVYRAAWSSPPEHPWLLLPKEDLPEIRILWWALALFGVSELTCGIEVYVLLQSNDVTSAIHSFASAAGMALFVLGMFEYFDRRIIAFTRPACVANRICRGCTDREPEGCKFRVALLLAATFLALAALAPMFASVERMPANTVRWMLPFPSLNAWYDGVVVPWFAAHVPGHNPTGVAYFLPESMFRIEFRFLPAVALALLAAGACLVWRGDEARGARAMIAAAGVLGYCYFELVLYRGIGDVLIGSLGHELAEFWFLVFTAEFLTRCFPANARAPAVSS